MLKGVTHLYVVDVFIDAGLHLVLNSILQTLTSANAVEGGVIEWQPFADQRVEGNLTLLKHLLITALLSAICWFTDPASERDVPCHSNNKAPPNSSCTQQAQQRATLKRGDKALVQTPTPYSALENYVQDTDC